VIRRWLVLAALLPGAALLPDATRAADRPTYQDFRYDEDWRAMTDPAQRTDVLDPIKWVPITNDPDWYVTFGGELRERYEASRNPVFGLSGPARNDYLLHRLFLFGDLHLGPQVRTFVEVVNGLTAGWRGTPPATQENQLDLLQGFAEWRPLGDRSAWVRAGRQEMSFGSSRLISVREAPNVRRAFDGVRASWSGTGIRVDGFAVRPVAPQRGSFNDPSDSAQAFWGAYATVTTPVTNVDVYYLGLTRENARFAQGTATERRHTIGARQFGKRGAVDWNIEEAVQFGSFGEAAIRAWTVSANLGFTARDLPLAPRFGFNADAISGDRDATDGTLGTFNPLFPKLPYFSEANLAAPANLYDIQPNLTLSLTPDVTASVGWNLLWKQALADAFYAPPLSPVRGTAGGSGRFIGQQVSLSATWSVTDALAIGGTYVHYEPGGRTRAAGGQAGDFFTAWLQWQF